MHTNIDRNVPEEPLFRRLDEIERQELREQRMLGETDLERPKTLLGFTDSATTYFVSVVLVALAMLFVIFMVMG